MIDSKYLGDALFYFSFKNNIDDDDNLDGSTTIRVHTFRLLLYTSAQDSYTSNFCFSKSLSSSIPTSTYTMIPFYQSHFY